MSDKPDIEGIKARLAAATPGPWALVDFPVMFPRVQSIAEDKTSICETWEWADAKFIAAAPTDLAALLAENERLQRERSEWCDQADRRLTDYTTQQRDLLAENAALRARLTLTPEKVEAALDVWFKPDEVLAELVPLASWKAGLDADGFRAEMRAALLAAGMEEGEQ